MKSIYLFLASLMICTFVSCRDMSSTTESIFVTYFAGCVEFSHLDFAQIRFERIHENPIDTIYISKAVYDKMKEYAYSQEAQEHSKHIDARLRMRIDTVTTYFGIAEYDYHPSDRVQEMEYTIKCNSHYYDFFTTDDLSPHYCNEISKFGIPKNYHYIDLSKDPIKKEPIYCYLLLVK